MATIKGKGAPTKDTPGSIGDIYIDTTAQGVSAYKCTFAYKVSFREPEYEWVKTDDIPVTYEEEKSEPVEEPVEETSEEVPEEKVEETKPNNFNYNGKPRNNYNKQYRK